MVCSGLIRIRDERQDQTWIVQENEVQIEEGRTRIDRRLYSGGSGKMFHLRTRNH